MKSVKKAGEVLALLAVVGMAVPASAQQPAATTPPRSGGGFGGGGFGGGGGLGGFGGLSGGMGVYGARARLAELQSLMKLQLLRMDALRARVAKGEAVESELESQQEGIRSLQAQYTGLADQAAREALVE